MMVFGGDTDADFKVTFVIIFTFHLAKCYPDFSFVQVKYLRCPVSHVCARSAL